MTEKDEDMPLVSVIIPLHNQRQYVGDAIDSVLAQDYPDVELVVVDDGSTDEPGEVLEGYQGRLTLVTQENMGLSAARNTGIRNTKGQYIQFLDADDTITKDKIRRQVDCLTDSGCEVTYCEVEHLNEESGKRYVRHVGEVKDMFPWLYNLWHVYPLPIHCMLFKREVFDRNGLFDDGLKANEDRYFLSRLAAKGTAFHYCPFVGGMRRMHGESMNRDLVHMAEGYLGYYRRINEELGDDYVRKRFRMSPAQMIRANMTFLYLNYASKDASPDELRQFRRYLEAEGVRLYGRSFFEFFGFERFENLMSKGIFKKPAQSLLGVARR